MIRVELVFADEQRQELRAYDIEQGTTAAQLIRQSKVSQRFPGADFTAFRIGVWGHFVTPDYVLQDGDRLEIYRNLSMDPREARRQVAELGRTMNQGRSR